MQVKVFSLTENTRKWVLRFSLYFNLGTIIQGFTTEGVESENKTVEKLF